MLRLKRDWGRGECRMEKEKNGKIHIFLLTRIIVCVNVDGIEGWYGGGGWGREEWLIWRIR